ncbi:MAG: MFS transporter, partial [Ktedonobacterales bacterium]
MATTASSSSSPSPATPASTVPASASALTPAARRRGLITILVDTFLVWGGFYMVIPLISVHYVDQLGWAAAGIGVVLAIRQLLQQGLTPISGIIADRFGPKGLICAGVLLRSVGFVAMAWATTFPLLMLSAILTALGGSLFESPKSAAIAALTDDAQRNRFYSLTGIASALGITIGTQIGALLLNVDFALVALLGAACFLLDFFITLIFLPSVRVATHDNSLTYGIGLALRDRTFVLYSTILMGFWFLWVQFNISMPLVARSIGGSNSTVALVYTINSGMSLLLGYPILRLAERWLRPLPILILGLILMSAGLGAVALATSIPILPILFACVVCFAFGALLAMPSQQTVTARLSNPAALGSYFGVNALALALGGGLGNLSGGLLYDAG